MELPDLVVRFQETFRELGPGLDMGLSELYAPDVVFEDPAHRVEGLDALTAYFDRLNEGLRRGTFRYGDVVASHDRAAVPWMMALDLRSPKLRIEVEGVSMLRFADRIVHQRDHFDLGALLYEQVPLVGAAVRFIKRRFAAG